MSESQTALSYNNPQDAAAASNSGMSVYYHGSWHTWSDPLLTPVGDVGYSSSLAAKGGSGYFKGGKSISKQEAQSAIKKIQAYQEKIKKYGLPQDLPPAGYTRVDVPGRPAPGLEGITPKKPYNQAYKQKVAKQYIYDKQTNTFIPIDYLTEKQRTALLKELPDRYVKTTKYVVRTNPNAGVQVVGPANSQLVQQMEKEKPESYAEVPVARVSMPEHKAAEATSLYEPSKYKKGSLKYRLAVINQKFEPFRGETSATGKKILSGYSKAVSGWSVKVAPVSNFIKTKTAPISKIYSALEPTQKEKAEIASMPGVKGFIARGSLANYEQEQIQGTYMKNVAVGYVKAPVVVIPTIGLLMKESSHPERWKSDLIGAGESIAISFKQNPAAFSGEAVGGALFWASAGAGVKSAYLKAQSPPVEYTTQIERSLSVETPQGIKTISFAKGTARIGRTNYNVGGISQGLTNIEGKTSTTAFQSNLIIQKTSGFFGKTPEMQNYAGTINTLSSTKSSYIFKSTYGTPKAINYYYGPTGNFQGATIELAGSGYTSIGSGRTLTKIETPSGTFTKTFSWSRTLGEEFRGETMTINTNTLLRQSTTSAKDFIIKSSGTDLKTTSKSSGEALSQNLVEQQKNFAFTKFKSLEIQKSSSTFSVVSGLTSKKVPKTALKLSSGVAQTPQKRQFSGLKIGSIPKVSRKQKYNSLLGSGSSQKVFQARSQKKTTLSTLGLGLATVPAQAQGQRKASALALRTKTQTVTQEFAPTEILPPTAFLPPPPIIGGSSPAISSKKYKPPKFRGLSGSKLEDLTPRADWLSKTMTEAGGGIGISPSGKKARRTYKKRTHYLAGFMTFPTVQMLRKKRGRKKTKKWRIL